MPETLRQLVSRGHVDPTTALSILGQLLKALESAHWRGIIYGNITPEDVGLTSTGQATLAAFGIAHVADDPVPAQAGIVTGHSAYAAPEQIYGDPVDERADIFALGVVAYEMLTGKHPFGASDGLSVDSVISRILYQPPLEIPRATLAGLPPHIPPVLEVALAKEGPEGPLPRCRKLPGCAARGRPLLPMWPPRASRASRLSVAPPRLAALAQSESG